jgi:hypothetical protein
LFYFTGNKTPKVDLPLLVIYGLFANGPDLDFLAGAVVGDSGAFHHGISHSFGFGLIFTVAAAVILAKAGKRFAEFGLLRLYPCAGIHLSQCAPRRG